jgi:alpha-maltose-1-phosphate synthase
MSGTAGRHPRVTVVSGGKFHAYHLARAAERAGVLERFVTTIFDAAETGIPREKVVEIAAPAWAARALRRLTPGGRPDFAYWIGDNWFDLAASRWAGGADVYHAFNHHALFGLRAAHRAGAVTLVERSSAHPRVQQALLAEESARFGLSLPRVSERVVEKHLREYEEADWIMVPSTFVHRTMVESGVPDGKLRLLPLGVDADRFAPGPKRDDVFRVLFVGAISLQKGIPHLLEGFRRAGLPPRESELLLVGEPTAEARAFLPRYEGLYRLEKFVPQGRLPDVYRQASVFVLPSIQDGFGMVAYEAAACGLPVIVSENVGAEIRDGEDGFVVPIRDPDAIADRLVRLRDEDARRRMGASARSRALSATWERYGERLARHYAEVWPR